MGQKYLKIVGYAGLVLALAMLVVLSILLIAGESVPGFVMPLFAAGICISIATSLLQLRYK